MTETTTPAVLVSGVMALFPGADRQALLCLAELMEKDRREAADTIDALVEAAEGAHEVMHRLMAILPHNDAATDAVAVSMALIRAALAKAKGTDND